MQKAVDFLQDQLHGISSIGANVSLVETVKVNYYGQQTPIKHVAFSGRDGLRISITPHESQLVPEIVRACKQAGFNAYQFSKEMAVVTLPPPSGETKQETMKRIKALGEEAKVAIRQVRKKFKKGADDKSDDNALQEITDEATSLVDKIVAIKMSYFE